MSFRTEGVLHKKFDTQKITDTFSKRELVLQTEGNYPQLVKFELSQVRCDLLDSYNLGDILNVSFDIRGREWTSPTGDVRYFNTLNVWKIELLEKAGNYERTAANSSSNNPTPPPADDDLPF